MDTSVTNAIVRCREIFAVWRCHPFSYCMLNENICPLFEGVIMMCTKRLEPTFRRLLYIIVLGVSSCCVMLWTVYLLCVRSSYDGGYYRRPLIQVQLYLYRLCFLIVRSFFIILLLWLIVVVLRNAIVLWTRLGQLDIFMSKLPWSDSDSLLNLFSPLFNYLHPPNADRMKRWKMSILP